MTYRQFKKICCEYLASKNDVLKPKYIRKALKFKKVLATEYSFSNYCCQFMFNGRSYYIRFFPFELTAKHCGCYKAVYLFDEMTTYKSIGEACDCLWEKKK